MTISSEIGEFDIAITGISLNFPGARSLEDFWHNLSGGVSSIRRFTAQELRESGVSADMLNNPRYVPVSGYLEDAGAFDADLFRIPRSEARIIDPQHRQFLECAWDALEDSGYDPQRLDGKRVGCYGGAGMAIYSGSRVASYLSEYLESEPLDNLFPLQAFIATQNDHLCMRVSHRLGLRGPSISVQTACSTGLVAVHLAAQSLLVGETDMALAGASGIHFPVGRGYLYEEGGILSPDGVCRPFDAQASGTVGGSGAAVVVLRRLEDAISDGDPIWAVIKGSAVNNDGHARAGYLAPSVEGQREVILSAQRAAGVTAQEIGFVEAHGTGTSLGDSIELTALSEVFKENSPRSTILGAVKSSIGHLDTAAGMAGLIKAVLAVRERTVPGTLNFREPNEVLAQETCPFIVSADSLPWPTDRNARYAGVSSFGGGGTNAHVILGPAPTFPEQHGSGPYVLMLSGRDAHGVSKQASAYARVVRASNDEQFPAICRTANVGRPVFSHQAVVVAADHKQMAERLSVLAEEAVTEEHFQRDIGRGISTGVRSDDAVSLKPVFLFSGQGSTVAAATKLLMKIPVFASALEECRDLSRENNAWFDALIFDTADLKSQAGLAQPALFAFQYALTRLWASVGIKPSAVLGHSLGEYAAACASGVMNVETAINLVITRGALMDRHCGTTRMLAIMASAEDVQDILRETNVQAELAVTNGERAVVIGGSTDALNKVKEALGPDIITIPLETTHGFHTSAVDPMLPHFDTQLEGVVLGSPIIHFESTSEGNSIPVHEPGYWVDQVRKPVNFAQAFRSLAAQHNVFIEIGPAGILTNLGKRIDSSVQIIASLNGNEPSMEQLYEAAAALHVRGGQIDFGSLNATNLGHSRASAPLSHRIRQDLWVGSVSSRSSSSVKHESELDAIDASTETIAPIAETLFGRVEWTESHEILRPSDEVVALHWIIIVSVANPLHELLLTDLQETGFSHSVTDVGGLDSLRRDLRSTHQRVGVILLTEADEMSPSRVVAETSATLREVLEPSNGCVAIERVVVVQCEIESVKMGGSRSSEAVDALLRCVRLEYPRTDIGSVRTPVEDLCSKISQFILFREPEVYWDEGRRYVRQIENVETLRPGGLDLKPDATYLVSGGAGGVGRHVLHWLIQRGARHMVVINRNISVDASNFFEELRALGIDVLVARADVADPNQMRELTEFLRSSMPPVRGVLHLAGILDDATLMNLKEPTIKRVFEPKVHGAQNLLAMTFSDDLDFFITFSSIASTFGSPGQSAYASANASMDGVIRNARWEGRRRISSVSWGPWAGGGMHASLNGQFAQHSAFDEIDPQHATMLLDQVVLSNGGDFIAVRIKDYSRIIPAIPTGVDRVIDAVWSKGVEREKCSDKELVLRGNLADILSETVAWQRPAILEDYLCGIVSEQLELSKDNVDIHIPLREIGIDSLHWVRLRNRLVIDIGFEVPLTMIYSYPSISALSTRLLEEVEANLG
ncbi:type I polyketide synthase [Paenibacillus xylanexedens]|uniref:type I polyketide synthase n=1 Tax=Paenibacillus xylanexedens TaxID=528191 RepID=UPI003B01B27E